MNFYSHNLLHEERVREWEKQAKHYHHSQFIANRTHHRAYKMLINNVGKTLVRLGTSMQDLSES